MRAVLTGAQLGRIARADAKQEVCAPNIKCKAEAFNTHFDGNASCVRLSPMKAILKGC